MKILTLKNVSFHHHANYIFKHEHESVLKDINYELESGKCTALMGRSGSGKSTLAQIIMGLLKPSHGEVLFNEKPLNLATLKARREFYSQVQMIFQDPISAVNPNFSVKQVLLEPLKHLLNLEPSKQDERIEKICEQLYIKKEYLNKRAINLSGGELGRVCLARAIIIKPKLLILDESLSGFDLGLSVEILKFLNSLKGKMSFIFITHDLRLTKNFADEVILLENGRIVEKTTQKFTSEFGKALQNAML